jgi:outer membrane protein assembly factor BamB
MNKGHEHTQNQSAPPGRFTMIAAVVFLMLLVGSAVAVFQLAREGRTGAGRQQTTTCTVTSSAAPAADQPDVYALVDNTLYRFDPASHKTLWNFHMPPIYRGPYTGFHGQVINGIYYQVGTNTDGYYLYALNTANGRIRWRMRLGSVDNLAVNSSEYLVMSGGPVIANGIVYVSEASTAGGYSEIIARNAATGNEIWQHQYTGTGTASGAKHNRDFTTGLQLQTAANGVLYANDFMRQHGTSTLTLFAISGTDGSIKWQTTANPDEMVIGEQAVDGRLYLSTVSINAATGQVFAYNATTGELQWTSQPFVGTPGSPIVDNGIVYIGTENGDNASGGSVYALQASSGSQLWHYTAQAGVSTPVVAGGIVYIAASPSYGGQHTVAALDGMTGATCWSHTTDASMSIPSPLAVSKHFMYLSMSTNTLVALRLSDGSQVGTYTISEAPAPSGTSNPEGPDSNMTLTVAPSS